MASEEIGGESELIQEARVILRGRFVYIQEA
jgi:hypothetical protein